MIFIKFDYGKLELHLIPPEFEEALANVLMYGKNKYAEDGWKNIEGDVLTRTLNSILRHLLEIRKGNEVDKESGHLHIIHAATQCAIYYYHLKEKENELRS